MKQALLKINDCFSFCNVTNDRKLVLVNGIKDKMLIKSIINPKASYFGTKIVVKHNKFALNRLKNLYLQINYSYIGSESFVIKITKFYV